MERRRSFPQTFDDRISDFRARLEEQLAAAGDHAEKLALTRKLRQLDTAANINSWLSSADLRAPK